MPTLYFSRIKAHWLRLLCMTLVILGMPLSCSVLKHEERSLLFQIEPGTASWYHGLPADVEELELKAPGFGDSQNIHAWWWPAAKAGAPAVLYLHGTRWNLTGQFFRIEQLHAMGFSVLAIDYRGFGQSLGPLPSEVSVYEDARIAWARLKVLQPDATKRLLYGHSLGGAVAIDLAAELGRDAESDGGKKQARGLIIESTFTTLADVATAVANTSLPVRWLLSQKFDSIDKIAEIHMPVLIVHGMDDPYVPSRFSEALYQAAQEPKRLLLVPGGTHNNSMSLGRDAYSQAIQTLLKSGNAATPLEKPIAFKQSTAAG
ncbi:MULTISPECIES: alpha/beta hydrolase [unclassified Pseudomonas]|uniref:alpha/beta hydrolase n=2 Tax=unclassified Pseudomonas TaxID=196821 RepID=UPI00387ED26C